MPSFDIVSKVDTQEVENAVNQAIKEIGQRYDFKGSKSEIMWDKKEIITALGDDDYKLNAVIDILKTRLIKRGVSLKALKYGNIENASGGMSRQIITLRQGISRDEGKNLVKIIKKTKLKVQSHIMEDQLRISGKNKDDLQSIMNELKSENLDINLQFVNYRD